MKDRRAFVIILALALDLLWGDPPNRWHPVILMGRFLAWGKSHAPQNGVISRFLFGLSLLSTGIAGSAAAGWALLLLLGRLPWALALFLQSLFLKFTFSLRGLLRAATDVEYALALGDIAGAQRWLAWHLVSRDVTELSRDQIAAATIESLAENTSDGILAPLFFYTLGGLPAALAYRFLNTADAMLGYHDVDHEWLGKASARLDDLVNLFPARFTALCLTLTAGLGGSKNTFRAWHIWRRDAHHTASPNAGHPMSAMAGALGVTLEKEGHYRLGQELRPATPHDIAPALRLVKHASLLGVGLLAVLGFILERKGRSRA